MDVAVLYQEDPPSTLDGMGFEVAEALEARLERPVEVVVLNRAPAELVHRVLRDSILLCNRDNARRVAFEVRKRGEYFDLRPILERYRRYRPGEVG